RRLLFRKLIVSTLRGEMRLVVVALFFVMTGCSSFQGQGDLQTADYETPDFQPGSSLGRYESPFTSAPAGTVKPHRLNLEWPVIYPSRINRGFQTDHPHYGIDFSGRRNAPILA